MSPPIPIIKTPPAFGPAARSDYTGRAVALAKTLKPKRKSRQVGQTFLSVPSGPSSSHWIARKSRGLQILQVPALNKIPWLIHGFSTRPGGVSPLGGEEVLNLGFTAWDPPENVLENRRRFQSALGARDLQLISLTQIHSDVIHLFHAAPAEPCRGDASATN